MRIKRVLIIGSWTFFLSIVLNYGSMSALETLSLAPSFAVLMLIILVGIVFDIIGTATTAAREHPFTAMATKRIPGSREALSIVHQADSVASFCNDVVGDICGTLSGALVAVIIVLAYGSDNPPNLINTILVAITAAITVGGKAYGKGLAIKNYVPVLMIVGRIIYFFQNTLGFNRFFKEHKKRKK